MNIQETILEIRKEMDQKVSKNGTNTFHNYKFAKATDVIAHCRELCNKHGLLIVPKGLDDISYKKNDSVVSGNVVYELSVGDGSSINAIVYAAGEDKGDKHAYKLMTGALKYLLMQVFLLETDDDPEATEGNDTKVVVRQKVNINDKNYQKALQRIELEGEVLYKQMQEYYLLSPEQDVELLERLEYTKNK